MKRGLWLLGLLAIGCVADASRFVGGGQRSEPDATSDGGAPKPDSDASGEVGDATSDSTIAYDAVADTPVEPTVRDATSETSNDASVADAGGDRDASTCNSAYDAAVVGFSQNCRPPPPGAPCPAGNAWLCLECSTLDGKWVLTAVNTSACITNADGHLYWQPGGGYAGSCSEQIKHLYDNCGNYVNTILIALCSPISGPPIQNTFQLTDGIANVDGHLHCTNGGA
jgi:hypothetical protein